MARWNPGSIKRGGLVRSSSLISRSAVHAANLSLFQASQLKLKQTCFAAEDGALEALFGAKMSNTQSRNAGCSTNR